MYYIDSHDVPDRRLRFRRRDGAIAGDGRSPSIDAADGTPDGSPSTTRAASGSRSGAARRAPLRTRRGGSTRRSTLPAENVHRVLLRRRRRPHALHHDRRPRQAERLRHRAGRRAARPLSAVPRARRPRTPSRRARGSGRRHRRVVRQLRQPPGGEPRRELVVGDLERRACPRRRRSRSRRRRGRRRAGRRARPRARRGRPSARGWRPEKRPSVTSATDSPSPAPDDGRR